MVNKKDYKFDILKNKKIILPPCDSASGSEAKIDTFKESKLVWVTFDPLLEKVICVHDAPDCVCEVCKPIFEERQAEKSIYQLEEQKFEIKKYKENELEEV